MGSAEEEIYITMVVVKRPAQVHRPEDDPARWAQTVLDSLPVPVPAEASLQPGAVARSLAARTGRGRIGPSPLAGTRLSRGGVSRLHRTGTQASSWILLGLSLLCFVGSAYSFYFLMK